jgi:adenylylsulfate kinase-like enzyme
VNAPYEEPDHPEILVDAEKTSPEEGGRERRGIPVAAGSEIGL